MMNHPFDALARTLGDFLARVFVRDRAPREPRSGDPFRTVIVESDYRMKPEEDWVLVRARRRVVIVTLAPPTPRREARVVDVDAMASKDAPIIVRTAEGDVLARILQPMGLVEFIAWGPTDDDDGRSGDCRWYLKHWRCRPVEATS
jgi:hypothetical protein